MHVRDAAIRLSLDDGTRMHGRAFGALEPMRSEVVFNAAMTGYVEALTDPSEYSRHEARRSLHERLSAEGVPGLTGVDTRSLT